MRPLIEFAVPGFLLLLVFLVLAGCAGTPLPVNKPCGVLIDSLVDVQGKRRQDVQRIDRHFERGVAAFCWKR